MSIVNRTVAGIGKIAFIFKLTRLNRTDMLSIFG